MEPSKVYAAPRWVWILPIGVTGLVGYNYLTTDEWTSNIFIGALALLSWYGFLTSPLEVRLTEDNWVEAKTVLRQTRVRVEDILIIERDNKTTTLKHRQGKIELSYIINHLDDFTAQLQQRNPLIEETEGPLRRFGKSPAKMIGLMVVILALTLLVIILAINFPALGQ